MSNNIVTAKVSVKGVRPLLLHHFGPDAMPLEKKEKTGIAGNNPEEWRVTVLVTNEGQLFLEPTYVFATLVNGARYIKRGRGSIMPLVASTLQVLDDKVLLDRWFPNYPNGHSFDVKTVVAPVADDSQPVYLDIRSVRNPATKGRNVRYRVAASMGWGCNFTLKWDKTVVSRGEMESVVINAGQLVGLADGRGIGFGRFEVQKFEIVE